MEENVLGEELKSCSKDPMTGFTRDGFCRYLEADRGKHQICSVMEEKFLQFSKKQGNDLITPRPEFKFPGLSPGDRWCLCVGRWVEALQNDSAPPVILESTSKAVLDKVPLATLRNHQYE